MSERPFYPNRDKLPPKKAHCDEGRLDGYDYYTPLSPNKSLCHYSRCQYRDEPLRRGAGYQYPNVAPHFHHEYYYLKPPHFRREAPSRSMTTIEIPEIRPNGGAYMQCGPPTSTLSATAEPWLSEDFIPSTPSHTLPSPVNVTPSRSEAEGGGQDLLIWDLREKDIVCGRGAPVNWQKGNQHFRYVIAHHQTEYLCSKRCDKPKIATKVMEIIKSSGGRFVRRVKAPYHGRFGWEEIHEKRAYEKVCQALREGAPELRRRMLASTEFTTMTSDKENDTGDDK